MTISIKTFKSIRPVIEDTRLTNEESTFALNTDLSHGDLRPQKLPKAVNIDDPACIDKGDLNVGRLMQKKLDSDKSVENIDAINWTNGQEKRVYFTDLENDGRTFEVLRKDETENESIDTVAVVNPTEKPITRVQKENNDTTIDAFLKLFFDVDADSGLVSEKSKYATVNCGAEASYVSDRERIIKDMLPSDADITFTQECVRHRGALGNYTGDYSFKHKYSHKTHQRVFYLKLNTDALMRPLLGQNHSISISFKREKGVTESGVTFSKLTDTEVGFDVLERGVITVFDVIRLLSHSNQHFSPSTFPMKDNVSAPTMTLILSGDNINHEINAVEYTEIVNEDGIELSISFVMPDKFNDGTMIPEPYQTTFDDKSIPIHYRVENKKEKLGHATGLLSGGNVEHWSDAVIHSSIGTKSSPKRPLSLSLESYKNRILYMESSLYNFFETSINSVIEDVVGVVNRQYGYTYINAFSEESAMSPLSEDQITHPNNAVIIKVKVPTGLVPEDIRLYRLIVSEGFKRPLIWKHTICGDGGGELPTAGEVSAARSQARDAYAKTEQDKLSDYVERINASKAEEEVWHNDYDADEEKKLLWNKYVGTDFNNYNEQELSDTMAQFADEIASITDSYQKALEDKLEEYDAENSPLPTTEACNYAVFTDTSFPDEDFSIPLSDTALLSVAPPKDLHGLINLPDGRVAGIGIGMGSENTGLHSVCFSRPFIPHQWLPDFEIGLEDQPVKLGAVGTSIIVLTEGHPYRLIGEVGEFSIEKMAEFAPCIAPRAAVTTDTGMVYPSTDGLVFAGQGGVKVISRDIMDRHFWKNPTGLNGEPLFDGEDYRRKLKAFYHDGHYIALSKSMNLVGKDDDLVTGGFTLKLSTLELNWWAIPIKSKDLDVSSGFVYQKDGELYLAAKVIKGDTGIPVFLLWQESEESNFFLWQTKVFEMSEPTSYGGIQFIKRGDGLDNLRYQITGVTDGVSSSSFPLGDAKIISYNSANLTTNITNLKDSIKSEIAVLMGQIDAAGRIIEALQDAGATDLDSFEKRKLELEVQLASTENRLTEAEDKADDDGVAVDKHNIAANVNQVLITNRNNIRINSGVDIDTHTADGTYNGVRTLPDIGLQNEYQLSIEGKGRLTVIKVET